MKPLIEVDKFGAIDAESDSLLSECFADHEAYLAAKGHTRSLIVGRKGSGKTAIFKRFLQTQGAQEFAFGHTFSDYPWHHHDLQKRVGVPEEQCYLHSWEYLILITIAKILLNYDHSQPCSEEAIERLPKLENFIIDSYGSKDPDVTQVFQPTKKLKISPHFAIDFGVIKGGANVESLPMEQLPTIVQEVNLNLSDAIIKSLNKEIDYFICFDELDLGFSPDDPNYKLRLIGLLLAARKLNLTARESNKKLSILVFLRDDIFDLLQFEDKNKITENAAVQIEWDTPGTVHTLQEIMEKRFGAVLDLAAEGSWDEVFDETKEMSGRQNKYQHIRDRTFLRPRDIIRFCNEVLTVYKARGGSELGKFENVDINEARNIYSDYLMRELDDEIHKHVPEYRSYMEVLKNLESLQFELDDFIDACKEREEILAEGYDARAILGQLFEFSLLGFYRPGGGGYGGAEYIWRYKDRRAQFNANAASFRIHPGFKEVLGLKKFTKSG